jgi:WD40 repeat protein
MSARTNVRSFPGDLEADDVSVAVSADVPAVSSVINSTNIGTTFLVGANPTVSTTNIPSPGEGVNFNFTVPRGDTGEVVIGQVSGGTTPSVTRNGTSTSAILDFVLPKGTDATTYFTQSGDDISYTTGNVGVGAAPPTGKKLYVDGTLGVGGVDLSLGFSPWILDTQLTGAAAFGQAVSISGDGNAIIVGAYTSSYANVYRYDTSTSQWDSGTQFTGTSNFAWDVRMSNDGNTVIVGAPASRYANVYRYDGSTWDNGTTFAGSSSSGFGRAVSVSGDGNTIILGTAENYANVYRYDTSTSQWDSGTQFTGSGSLFSWTVDISNDGNVAILGSLDNYANVYRYDTSTSQWDSGTQFTGTGRFGISVAVSGDGNTIIVGADTGDYANVYRYDTSTSQWDSGYTISGASGSSFGESVDISGDGNIVIVGSKGNYANVYRYDTSTSQWDFETQFTGTGTGYFGEKLAISSNGSVAVVGDYYLYYANVYRTETFLNVSKQIRADGSLLSFTGQHICTPEGPMERGLVVSANKNAYTTLNGPLLTGSRAIQSSESLPVVSLSTQENDPYVFGVVDHVEGGGTERVQDHGGIIVRKTKTLGDDRVIVNSLGEGAIWVVDAGGPLVSGDLISTSSVPGYGQRQSDDTFRNYTVAKITMDCDFNPPDIPVQVATTDENGKLKWEDTGETEKAYKTKTVEVGDSGVVYTAAYVGCTYHCG